ncbi:MAG: hypothetical protein RBR15_12755 [Sphaerochaeta sp.]|nr:hypothetical protein [Sphaerochaeta sp.]
MKHKLWMYAMTAVWLTMMSCSLNICGYTQGYQREQLGDAHWIAQQGDTYTFGRREGSVEESGAAIRFSRFFGRETLWTIDVQHEGYLHLGCSLIKQQGPFEVVLVEQGTDRVIRLASGQGSVEKEVLLEKGTHLIKILGYDAAGKLAITLSYPWGMSVRVSSMRF